MLKSNDNLHVAVVSQYSLHNSTKTSPEDFSMICKDEVDSADIIFRDNALSYLDTITEEEEDHYSTSSYGTSGRDTVQHHCSPVYRPNSENDLLEAQYLIENTEDREWFVGETNLEYDQYPYHQGTSTKASSPFTGEIFPVQLDGIAFYTSLSKDDIFQSSPLQCQIYLDKSGSKSLPVINKLSDEIHPLLRNMTSSNICTLHSDVWGQANSKAPSPTRTQLHDVAEWSISTPLVTTTTDTAGHRGTPGTAAVNYSVDTENDFEADVYEKEGMEIPSVLSKMKRSPAVNGVNVLLENTGSSLNDLAPHSTDMLDTASPVEKDSISMSESFSSSVLSLNHRYSESPQMSKRPVYDYGTDETLLEIFMTPAVDGMECGEENLSLNGSKNQLLASLAFNNLGMGHVWRDNCKRSPKTSDINNGGGNFNDVFDVPFIDTEESYSEAWFITASQQFSWLDRAQLADFEEITHYYDDASKEPLGIPKEPKLIVHPIKNLFAKNGKSKIIPSSRKLLKFQKAVNNKTDGEKNRRLSWMRQLCGCFTRNHGTV
ncbi:unnamed protein product [Rodentolepis nana]|uniref:Clathrin_bdg domain-containing protein n=1 Tax=Rodentolepis nana TaxID=102285 RepID=A0A0R3T7W6_RODNA|nr:unnamed protein product [Rodentolepis nana]